MKYIKKSSENEMIAVFLRAEIGSKRFGSNVARELTQLNVSRKLIDRPNLIDNQENALRRKILATIGAMEEIRFYSTIFRKSSSGIGWNSRKKT